MTAVDFEMQPSWYKDPTWILRDATLFPGFPVAVKSSPGRSTLSGFSVGMNSIASLKELAHHNGKSSYMNVLNKQTDQHGFGPAAIWLTLPRNYSKHLILNDKP